MSDLFKAERDTLAGLGLLAANHLRFDPALKTGTAVSHAHGFNVFSLVVDNVDGEVLAIERNRIHADDNPLQHAEQIGIRVALPRLHQKRPRPVTMPVEAYYKTQLFMGPGTEPGDFLTRGCTLYNTFDPCGFCAVTLLVCYMKRIAFLFDDKKFDGVYKHMGDNYFKGRQSCKGPLALVAETGDNPLAQGARLITALRAKVKQLEEGGVPLVLTLDACFDDLAAATALLLQVTPAHLATEGQERAANELTLAGIRKLCRLN